jgi:2-amino-4-hydroxy-6-hydroxymethyldihydropteridine diphosphokinase
MEALIALGSNIDKEVNLGRARAALADHPAIDLLAVSPIYVTAAIAADGALADQPAFYNAAVRVGTTLDAATLHQVLRAIETQLGRVRSADKFAPRPIDLDLAYYGDAVVTFENRSIPATDVLRCTAPAGDGGDRLGLARGAQEGHQHVAHHAHLL